MQRLAGLLTLAAVCSPIGAHGLGVVVLPLDASGTSAFEASRLGLRSMLLSLRDIPEVKVMESQAVSRELGVNLVEQVQLCRREVLCLVQIGEAVSAERMLLGELIDKAGARTVKLYVVDVTKAAMVDTLTLSVGSDDRVLENALVVAMRQLFALPDARVVFEVTPKDAQLEFYGERADVRYWEEIPFWAGTYVAKATRAGYEGQEVRIVLPRGGPTRVVIDLVPDLLYVDPTGGRRKPDATDPKRGKFAVVPVDGDGSGPGPSGPRVEEPSAFANLWAWGLVAAGGAAATVGGLVMVGAQSDYNDLSAEPRYLRGTTTSALDAIADREDARSRFGLGSKVLIGGVVVGVGGLVWMLVDKASRDEPPVASIGPMGEGGLSCVLRF